MNDDMRYTTTPFTLDTYWVVTNDDRSEFMVTAVPDGSSCVAFFEREDDAHAIHGIVPESDRTGEVMPIGREECEQMMELLWTRNVLCGIAKADGDLEVFVSVNEYAPGPPGDC